MSLAITLALRALSMAGVVLVVLVLVVVSLGATGYSDRVGAAVVREELRAQREALARTIRDPGQLEQALEARRKDLESFYRLDEPWYQRLPETATRVLFLDLGEARSLRSTSGSARVADIVRERVPRTMLLLTTALVITAAIGIPLGTLTATRAGGSLDRLASYLSVASSALPSWWTGVLFILLFAFYVRIFPAGGLYSAPPPDGGLARLLDLLWHAALPVITLVVVSLGGWVYVTRTIVLNTAQEPFVTVARAKGLPEGAVIRRHILRVAAPPILTNVVLAFTGSLGGAILTETVFNWPGMGRLYYDAITSAEETVIVALTFLFTLLYMGARLLLEVLYVLLDPRVRYGRHAAA